MANIDNREEIAKIDKENVLGSVEMFSDQCEHAFEDASKVEFPDDYKKVNNVVMTGMGGSGLGARVIESVYAKDLKAPLIRVNDYNLPDFVNENSLVFCSSYSGTTEEAVENAKQAIARKAKWAVIAKGGTLLEMARSNGVPVYQIDPKYNPSNQPRMSIGYMVVGQLVMASKSGLFNLKKADVDEVSGFMKEVLTGIRVEVDEENNEAKKLARLMFGKNIVFVSSEHLVGPMHVVNNQLNENAKVFSSDFVIPELNHHLMEGLSHPKTNAEYLLMVTAMSNLYSSRIQQRYGITLDVARRNNIETFMFESKGKSKLTQAFELIQFGAYANLYLSVLYGQDPAPIPWVDYFKEQLGQPLGK